MTDLVMPRLTDSMEEGTLITWLKKDGDTVAVGDEIAEIETDKASMVYEADAAGTFKTLVEEGVTLPIGTPIAVVGTAEEVAGVGGGAGSEGDTGGRLSSGAADATPPSPRVPPAPPSDPAADAEVTSPDTPPEASSASRTSATVAGDGERIKASPLARRVAADRGVDLGRLSGSGPGGRIIRVDVERAAVAAPVAAGAVDAGGERGSVEVIEPSRIQRVIADRMSESKATVPHFVLRTTVDMDRAVTVRQAFRQEAGEDGVTPSYNDLVVKAVARALRLHPQANGAWRDGHFELYSRINVGIAVATEGSLIVPVIADADRKAVVEIATEARALATRVRSGEITPPELAGGTFTVSNLGMFGVTGFDAVINPGQAGILAVGELAERPVVRDGEIVPGTTMELSLSCDHRILYGADGARFLATIRAGLEEPGLLA